MLRRLVSAAVPVMMLSMCVSAFAAGLWLDVPFVQQQTNGCGAASIAMVMQYWERHQGQPVRQEAEPARILRALYSVPADGIFASAMTHYFKDNGYRTFTFAGDRTDIEREMQNGRPLIAAIKPGSSSALHYVVVVGVDESQQLVLLNDPAQRKLLKEDLPRFEREWKATGRWTLMAVPETPAN